MWVPALCINNKAVRKGLTKAFLVLPLKSGLVLSWHLRAHACCEGLLALIPGFFVSQMKKRLAAFLSEH